jgi:transcriptional regulator with XRE-family HTH domain
MDRYSIKLGNLIVERRKELGQTQKSLAADLHISKQYLSDIERGLRHPRDAYFLQLLACLIHVSQDYVFYLTGQIPPDIMQADANVEEAIKGFDTFRQQLRERKV